MWYIPADDHVAELKRPPPAPGTEFEAGESPSPILTMAVSNTSSLLLAQLPATGDRAYTNSYDQGGVIGLIDAAV